MGDFVKEHQEVVGQQAVKALQKNGFIAEYFSTKAEARERLLALIPDGVSIGFGGSTTVVQMDVADVLKEKGCTLYNHAGIKDPEESKRIKRQEIISDIMLTGVNAITKDGRLYSVDAVGNRVAGMIFGPGEVILVAGVNKIVPDLAAAEERVYHIAGPINNIRIGTENPCTKTGECMDCSSARRICNVSVTLHRCPTTVKITVLLVGESLGF